MDITVRYGTSEALMEYCGVKLWISAFKFGEASSILTGPTGCLEKEFTPAIAFNIRDTETGDQDYIYRLGDGESSQMW